MNRSAETRYVYRFGGGVSDGGSGDRNLLGGKGANLAEMASIGLPVPPGFTISTEMCARYYQEGESFPDSLREEVANGIAHIEKVTGKRFGVWLGKRIPMVGGGVGAVVDGWSTASIAKHAQAEFPSRRPKLTGTVVQAG